MTKIQHKRSTVLNSGSAQAPSSAQLDFGELAINYNTADPQLFIKDSSGSVISILNSYAALDGATFTGDVNFDGEAVIKGDSTNAGALTLNSETNAKYVKVQAPANSGLTSYTLTLPNNDGSSGEVLTTDGSGNLSWALSSMSTADKNKLDGIAAGAEVNVNADWNAVSGDAQILNKPTIPTNNNQLTNGAGYISSFDITTQTDSKYLRSDIADSASGVIDFLGGSSGFPAVRIKSAGTSWSEGLAIHPYSDNNWALAFFRTSATLTTTTNTWALGNIGQGGTNNFGLLRNGLTGSSGIRADTPFDISQSGIFRFGFNPTVGSNAIWHAGNDGAGSGLDADILDGIQGSNYFRCDGTYPNTDMNSSVSGYWHVVSTASNLPVAYYGHRWDWDHVQNGQWVFQMYSATSGGDDLWFRQKRNYTAQTWHKVWTTGNDGAGSGLDADTVDGIQASTFVRTDARAISLNNGATGSTGNEITVGNSTPQYTLRDTHKRPIVQVTGAYPCFSLNHTTTSNANHGPTIQFSHNGYDSNEQIVVGSTGQGKYLDIGFSGGGYGTNTDNNPHNGISGYSGTTPVRIFSNGVLVGSTGAYGSHMTSTSYALDVRGTAYASSDMRAPIFYDSNNTAYYVHPDDVSVFHRGSFKNYNGSATTGNAVSIEIQNNFGTGDNGLAAMSFHCAGYYATHMHLRHDSYFGIGGWSASSWRWYVQMSTGNMTASGNVTAYSDIRLKKGIEPLHGCLDKLIGLNGVSFRWKDLPDIVGHPGQKDFGIIAQEVEKVFPEVIHESAHESPDGDKYKTVAYDKLVPVLIEAIKELSVRLTAIEDNL